MISFRFICYGVAFDSPIVREITCAVSLKVSQLLQNAFVGRAGGRRRMRAPAARSASSATLNAAVLPWGRGEGWFEAGRGSPARSQFVVPLLARGRSLTVAALLSPRYV